MLFRRLCPGCGATASRSLPCSACVEHLRVQLPPVVEPPPGIDRLLVRHGYDPTVRALILAAKNGGRRDLLARWGVELATMAAGESAGEEIGDRFDVVTWVPASRQGQRSRGYDQGKLLANAVAAAAGLRRRRFVIRRPGPTRIGADRAVRMIGPDLRCPIPVPPRILLVDDVLTTGASLTAAALALRSAGAEAVTGVVVAAAGNDHVGTFGRRRLGCNELGSANPPI